MVQDPTNTQDNSLALFLLEPVVLASGSDVGALRVRRQGRRRIVPALRDEVGSGVRSRDPRRVANVVLAPVGPVFCSRGSV